MSQSRARAARKPSLRDQLARKRAKVITLYFPVDDQGEQAKERVVESERDLSLAKLRRVVTNSADAEILSKLEQNVSDLERVLADAVAQRDEHCMALRIRGLSEDDRDALYSTYPIEDLPEIPDGTPDDKRAELEAQRDKVTAENKRNSQEWTYAALSQVVEDSDLTADEWREELTSGRWTANDVAEIRDAILRAYGAQPADSIPKG